MLQQIKPDLYVTTSPYLSSKDIALLKLDATNEVNIRVGAKGMYVQVRTRTAPKPPRQRKGKRSCAACAPNPCGESCTL